jgi:hypothetical protein
VWSGQLFTLLRSFILPTACRLLSLLLLLLLLAPPLHPAAAYEQAVAALFADPDTADELYAIIAPALRNGPALAWALVSNQTNAETLDGWAFQKLPSSK